MSCDFAECEILRTSCKEIDFGSNSFIWKKEFQEFDNQSIG